MAITLSAFSFSAFAAEDNATGGDGEAGRAKATSSYYRGDECMWKVTLYVGKSDTVDKNSSLVNDFYKLGSAYIRHDVYEMYEPFYFGNGCKADYLNGVLLTQIRKNDIVLITDNTMPYAPVLNKYTDPATGKKINKSSIEDVKGYFGASDTLYNILDEIAKKKNVTPENLVKSYSFTIGDTTKIGFPPSMLMPNGTSNKVPWVIVYEPVTVLHVREGSSEVKENLAFTATEFTLAEMTNFRKLDGAGKAVAYQLSPNSVQLEDSWFGYPVYPIRGSEESWTPTQVLFGGGWGMRFLEPAEKAAVDLSAEFIIPNADYHKGVTVISTVRISDKSDVPVLPSDHCIVEFKATCKKNGTETEIYKGRKEIVVPENENNIVWFKWTVPDDVPIDSVTLYAEVDADKRLIEKNRDDNYATMKRPVYSLEYSQTPDTQYERTAPSSFKQPALPGTSTGSAKWQVYEYIDGAFKKVNYAMGISSATVSLSPDPDIKSTTKNNKGLYVMRSGYGFSLDLKQQFASYESSGYLAPKGGDYTDVQYVYAKFPEFGYRRVVNEYRTLQKVGSIYKFYENPDADGKERFHFTPLWYPDGEYRVLAVISEVWTPSGMIESQKLSEPIIISGNAYDDWYITHK